MQKRSKNKEKFQKIEKRISPKQQKNNQKLIKQNDGITLLALCITIIVILILASITIGTISGDNGILNNATMAKERSEIADEKEIIGTAIVRSMGKNKRGDLEEDEFQNELDKILGERLATVTLDTEDYGFFVKFETSGRIYKVDRNGNVEYLGIESELITQADITATPESNTTPELTQTVELTIETPILIEGAEYSLVYSWSKDKENAPEDSQFTEEKNLEGTGRIRKATVNSSDTEEGDYYLWVRIVVGEIEKEKCFGPYAIKDHTTLVTVDWNSGLATGGFLGNNEVPRGKIQNINIITSLEGHSLDDENTWDISQSKDGTYLAWYEVNENGYYDVTIAGEGGVVANSRSEYLFKNIGTGVENGKVTITGLEHLDTELVTGMDSMFESCKAEEIDVSNFNTGKVTTMALMFNGCKAKSIDLSSFNTSNVNNMDRMFENCQATNLDLSNFNTSQVTNVNAMFRSCKATSIDVSSFDTRNVTSMNCMFESCKVKNLDLSSFNTRNVTNMNRMFTWDETLETLDIRNFDTGKVTNMNSMFAGCTNLKELAVSHFDTSNVTAMTSTFYNCRSLTELDVTNFNTSKVRVMNSMFWGCSNLTEIDVKNFDTSNVTNIELMFASCSNLTSIDLSNFNTNKVTSMQQLFNGCGNLKEANLCSFETPNLSDCNLMFYGCRKLEKIDIRKIEIPEICTKYQQIFERVPASCNIIVNENMSNWMDNNGYSVWNNRLII